MVILTHYWSPSFMNYDPTKKVALTQNFLQCDIGSLPDLLTHKPLPEIEKVETLETL